MLLHFEFESDCSVTVQQIHIKCLTIDYLFSYTLGPRMRHEIPHTEMRKNDKEVTGNTNVNKRKAKSQGKLIALYTISGFISL